ncbi:MAG: ABC transporter substrate-binding protein [Chloroflexota bacterium]|nr:ABC transporter substrate-binding protein [Chloroflexota bacterium]
MPSIVASYRRSAGGGSAATATIAKPATGAATTAPAAATTVAPTAAAGSAAVATRPAGSTAAGTTAPVVAATSAPVGTTAAATGGTIKFGMITSLTGPYNPLGGFNKQAADLLVKQINDTGGINGAKIELQIEDDTSNPSQALTAVKKLIANKVVAIIGPVFSSSCVAILDEVEAAKIPMITQCAADSVVTPIRPNIFLGPQSTRIAADQLLGYLKSEGKTKIALLHDSTEYGSLGGSIIKADAAKYGITSVDEQLYELTATTFIPQLTKIKNGDAQAIISWGSGAPAVTITKEYKQLGIAIPLSFSGAQASPLYTKPAGDAASGVIVQCQLAPIGKYLPDSNPSKALITKFDADFMAAYNTAPAQFAYNTYDAMQLFVAAIKKAGPDPAKIRDAVEQTKGFVSVDGTFNYSATDHTGLSIDDIWVAQVTNGALVPTKYGNGK